MERDAMHRGGPSVVVTDAGCIEAAVLRRFGRGGKEDDQEGGSSQQGAEGRQAAGQQGQEVLVSRPS